MARPRFSEMLLSRRHQLGLSISQASKILKLREDVLRAFEEGDYEHMPQTGYTQGMLSSYARYLGLNPREVVDLYQEEHYQYKHGTSSHELRRRTRDNQAGRGVGGYDLVNEAGSRPKAYVEYRPLLPTSGGPAGDMGDYATTTPARPRTSVPLAGAGTYSAGTRSSYSDAASRYAPEPSHPPYNASAPARTSASTARRRAPGQRRLRDDQTGRLISEGQRAYVSDRDRGRDQARTGRLYRRDDVSTRRVRPSEYTDDLRYDDHASPYSPASTISGRRSSRNIANVERPNVRRRPSRGRAGGSRGSSRRRGPLGGFLSDSRRVLLLLVLVLALVLTAILVFSVSSCVSGRSQPSTGQTVPVGTTSEQQGTPSDSSDGEADGADDDASSATADDDAANDGSAASADGQPGADADGSAADDASGEGGAAEEAPKETVVDVEVESGEVTWVEITCDGASVVADTLTGPWSGSYTVQDSITVYVANTDVVTVTENGERREFTSRVGGVGSVTIEGTPLSEDADNAESATGQ